MLTSGAPAIVTGGASGLGEAVVRRLVASGSRVAVLDRDHERGAAISEATGCAFVAVDISDDKAVADAVDQAISTVGVPRIVVTCAGIAAGGSLVVPDPEAQYARFDTLFKVNVYGTFSLLRHVVPAMIKLEPKALGERGVIVTTGSISGLEGQAGQIVYAASKAAIMAMTLPAARELSDFGIRVCSVAPGVFETPLLGPSREISASLEREIPFPRGRGDPAAFADLVDHIITNPYLNGEIIRLDAGLRQPPFRAPRP